MCVCLYVFMSVCMHVCMCMYMYVCVYVCMYVGIYIYVCMCVYEYMYEFYSVTPVNVHAIAGKSPRTCTSHGRASIK